MHKMLFNDKWNFEEGAGNGMFATLMGLAPKPVVVNLPHDAVIGTERVNEANLGPVGFYKGKNICYTKNFDVPADWSDKVVWVEFEGIHQNAMIYVNNAYAGTAVYGYGEHYFDIGRFLEPGKSNTIKVLVKNGSNPAGRWYTGGGIYRDVQLHVANRLHITCTGTRVSTEYVEDDQATVIVVTPVVQEGLDVVTAFIKNEVLDDSGTVVASEAIPTTFFDHGIKELRQRLVVPTPKLWDAETPNLYTIRTTVTMDGQEIDTFESAFGIRSMQLDAKKGLRINGKVVKLRGGCIHHDNGVLGAATFYDAEERRIRIMKEMGYNAIRSAHHPIGKHLLDACDKLGMYIMDEFSDMWSSAKGEFDYGNRFMENYEDDVRQMVYKDYNHPSVILYSIGNEISEIGNKFDVSIGRKIVEIIHSIDNTRYTLNSINILLTLVGHIDEIMADMGIDPNKPIGGEINSMMSNLGEMQSMFTGHPLASKFIDECCGQLDISGYNYAEDRYEKDAVDYPNRILLGSETFPAKLAKNWAIIEKCPNVLGDFAWTSWDYLGEPGIGKNSYEGEGGDLSNMNKWPIKMGMAGTIDILGIPQPIAYWRQIVWGLRKEPYINVCPPEVFGKKVALGAWGWSDGQNTWTWRGDEGRNVDVDVYADADEIELFVNGKSLGRKVVGEDYAFMAKFQAVYEPGEIKAVAYKNGETAEQALYTAGDVTLSVAVENPEIAVQTGTAFVNITLQDADGVVDPCAKATVTVEVEGGTLQGLGSADPESLENFTANTFDTYRGRLLAVVRAENAGTVNVKVSAGSYGEKTVAVIAK